MQHNFISTKLHFKKDIGGEELCAELKVIGILHIKCCRFPLTHASARFRSGECRCNKPVSTKE